MLNHYIQLRKEEDLRKLIIQGAADMFVLIYKGQLQEIFCFGMCEIASLLW
jgi:hypothetical protein